MNEQFESADSGLKHWNNTKKYSSGQNLSCSSELSTPEKHFSAFFELVVYGFNGFRCLLMLLLLLFLPACLESPCCYSDHHLPANQCSSDIFWWKRLETVAYFCLSCPIHSWTTACLTVSTTSPQKKTNGEPPTQLSGSGAPHTLARLNNVRICPQIHFVLTPWPDIAKTCRETVQEIFHSTTRTFVSNIILHILTQLQR